MIQPEETRAAARKILRCRARVGLQTGVALNARSIDISISGMCLMVDGPLSAGQSCMLMFETPIKGVPKQINVVAKVVYSICGSDGFRAGFQFVQPSATNTALINALVES
jgi:hypothetical protein